MDFFTSYINQQAKDRVAQVLESGFISEGKMVVEFESALRTDLGLKNPVTLNSCTTALHLAVVLAGVGPGDEVIVPPQTFVATGLAPLMQFATPVFADIDPCTGNLSVESFKDKITERTRAVIPVHWAGYPCDLDEIQTVADQHGISVIEDAAHAIGAIYKGGPIGSISRFTCFSFQAIKHVTTGDGGALCCTDDWDAKEAVIRRWFGIDRAGSKPSILGEREYDISMLGYKYHLNDIGAALGLGNLSDFSDRLARRQRIGEQYRRELAEVAGIELLEAKPDRTHSYWMFTTKVEGREGLIRKLIENDCIASVVHLRIDSNSVFGGQTPDLPGMEEFNEKQISLPVHEGLTEEDIARIIKTIKSGW